MHNFTFDDFKDAEYYHDYVVQQQLEPVPIDMKIDFDQLKLLVMTDSYNTPFAGINLGNLRIQWEKK